MVLTDNLGKLLAGHFRPSASNFTTEVILEDITGAMKTVRTYSPSTSLRFNSSSIISEMQIGKGTTNPTPQDINIESPFGLSPEADRFVTALASYILGSGKVTQTGFLSGLASNDAVSEVCIFMTYRDITSTEFVFLISRNKVDPPASFTIGQEANLASEVNF